MRRLYLQIYATLIAVLVLIALLTSFVWWRMGSDSRAREFFEKAAIFAAQVLPPPDASKEEMQHRLGELAGPFEFDAAVFSRDGERIAGVGQPVPSPHEGRGAGGSIGESRSMGPGRIHDGVFALALPDGRWLVVRGQESPRKPGRGLLGLIAFSVFATAVGAYPVVRRLTRRLEALQHQVEALGSGQLGARVSVEGRDEIADLARSFNRTAERIEQLIEDKKRVLAVTSHELRTPLARIRVAADLYEQDPRRDLRERIERDICELDELIAELLVASRLDSTDIEIAREPVDLLALVAEEAAAFGVEVGGESGLLEGDPRLLRRLIRNLLENAERYGGGATEARVEKPDSAASAEWLLSVSDRGPGVPEEERERIFEPFHRVSSEAGARDVGDSTRGASGLGLSLVRQIALRHGGSAECCGREGGGTRFEIRLPAGPAP
jgi:signal transduction histidine kinase